MRSIGNFSYGSPANDAGIVPLSLAIFADCNATRELLRGDVELAGFQSVRCHPLAELTDDAVRPLGDVVLLDCPQVDGATLAMLTRLDVRAAQSGAQLIVSTSVDALDDVFGCLDQSSPQILVDPGRAERVIALGQVLGRVSSLRVRELGEEDRLVLLRLTEQVGQIAQRLERLESPIKQLYEGSSAGAFQFESPGRKFSGQDGDLGDRLVRASRPSLPDPRLVRRIIRQRQLRSRFFDGDLFADPAWDMLLDLTAARAEHIRVSVTSLCIASGVPPTTALRWISQMIEAGQFQREEDEADRRRAFITMTPKAVDAMARYFTELGKGAAQLA
jgi:hypothetical protein